MFMYNEEYGMLLMSTSQDTGLDIPKDIALVNREDLPICEMFYPRLTSVNLGFVAPTRDVAVYLDQLIQGHVRKGSAHIPLGCKIVVPELD
jgi:DNA-binding LacI/PurR family transcriptional regulator